VADDEDVVRSTGPLKEPVRIVSDLHLGHPATRIQSADDLRFLLEGGVATLVINGDGCEQRCRAWRGEGEAMLEDFRKLSEAVGVDLICLRGNHDPWVSDLDWLELGDGALVVTHGDALFRHLSPWSPKVMKLSGEMDAVWDKADTDSRQGWFDAVQACRVLKPGKRDEVDEMQNAGPLTVPLRLMWPLWRVPMMLRTWWVAPRLATEFCQRFFPRAKAVIFGHTHWAGCWRRDGTVAVNTGGYVSIGGAQVVDLESGQLRVRKVKSAAGGGFELGEVVNEVGMGA